jgi:hypothetical protein
MQRLAALVRRGTDVTRVVLSLADTSIGAERFRAWLLRVLPSLGASVELGLLAMERCAAEFPGAMWRLAERVLAELHLAVRVSFVRAAPRVAALAGGLPSG